MTFFDGSERLWMRDAASPGSVSGAASIDASLDQTYDVVKIICHDLRGSEGSSTDLQMTINGRNSAYSYVATGGGETNGASQLVLLNDTPAGAGASLVVISSGAWDNKHSIGVHGGRGEAASSIMVSGSAGFAVSPLDSISLQWASGTISGTVEIYGRTVA